MQNIEYTFSFIPFTKEQQTQLKQENYNLIDNTACTTEVFVPYFHFGGKALNIQVNEGECEYDEEKQTLYHTYNRDTMPDNTVITLQLGILNNEQPSTSCIVM